MMGVGEPYTPTVDKWLRALGVQSIVDIGCGTGKITKYLNAKTVVGVDLCEASLLKARENRIKTVCEDVLEYLKHTQEGTFDVVTGFDIIEHMEKPKAFETMREAQRVAGKAFILGIPLQKIFPKVRPGDEDSLQNHRSLWDESELLGFGFHRVIVFRDYHYQDGNRFDAALCIWLKDDECYGKIMASEEIA